MAKKKSTPHLPDDGDLDFSVEVFTRLLCIVNPALDPEMTFDIVADMWADGLGLDNYELYGQLIRATAFSGSSGQH